LQEQLLEKQYPKQIDPTDDNTRGDRNQNTDDQSQQTTLFEKGRPSDNDLGDPVHTGDQEQQKLHQTALFVKPSHDMYLQNKFCTFILP
jgi:hypothetical protein